jgi:hypothetical protein
MGYHPRGEDFPVILALQVLVLLIGAGGSVLTAFTLPESRTKWAVVSTFGAAGVVGLILTVLTYEQLTFIDVGTWAWSCLQATWSYLTVLVQRRWLQILAAVIVGIVIGVIGPFAYDKLKTRTWYSSYEILQLAAPKLMEESAASEAEVHQLALRILDVQEERKRYREPFGSGPISPVSEAMEAFRQAISEASAKSSALREIRDRARRKAGDTLYEQLKTGKLIARGFVSPAGSRSQEVMIPAGYWKLLKFNNDLTEASSDNVRYIGVEIARA